MFQLIAAQASRSGEVPGLLVASGGGPYFERVRDLGVPVAAAGVSTAYDPRIVRRAARMMRGWDLHHFHSIEPGLFAASLLVRGAVRVYTNRGGEIEGRRGAAKRLRHWLGGAMLRRGFHGFSANTRHAARVAANRYGLRPDAVAVTPNGIDFSLLEPVTAAADVRRGLGIPPNSFVVGTAAILKGWKRVERLLEAAALIRDLPMHVVIVGDGPERARLGALADGLGIADRVVFTGMLARVGDHVAAMDAFVLTSGRQESFGNAVIEAMALAVPSVVFGDSPGAKEHVGDGITGLVVEDVPGLASALRHLASDPARARDVGGRGRSHVRSHYSLDAMVRSYREVYRGAIEASRE